MRKSRAKERPLLPDPRFQDKMVARFINNMMLSGKKASTRKIFYDAMDIIKEKTKEDGVDIFKKALDNCTPAVEVKSRRVGGATFQIPQEVRIERRLSLAMKWIILNSRARKGKPMSGRLSDELIAASREEGGAFKKKEDTHRMAEANKAFSHFRFR